MKVKVTSYLMRYLEWESISEIDIDIDPEHPDQIGCNELIFETMKKVENEKHPRLSYQLCEARFSKLEDYGIDSNESDPIERLVTKYELNDVRDHKTVGYVLCIWDCNELLQFNSSAKKFLDEYFRNETGTYTTYTVFDEGNQKLYSSHFRFSPLRIMVSQDPLAAFAAILNEEISDVLNVSNLLGLEPKYRYDINNSEFQFETKDGLVLKVKCDQLIAAKVKYDEENEPDSDLD